MRQFISVLLILGLASCEESSPPPSSNTPTSLLATAPVSPAASDQEALDYYSQLIIDSYQEAPDVGVAVAVLKDGEVFFSNAYGFRDRQNQLPMTVDTAFGIGSLSKSVTAFTMLQAEQQQLIDLGESVRSYLPEFNLANAEVADQITIEDMLSHRTGHPMYNDAWVAGAMDRDSLFDHLADLDVDAGFPDRFRTSYIYNNIMYAMTGEILERTIGGSWETFAVTELFQPLEMNDTGFLDTASALAHPNFARPYLGAAAIPWDFANRGGPAGSVFSTLNDMTKYTLEVFENHALLGEAVNARLFEEHNPFLPPGGSPFLQADWYGFGWRVLNKAGVRLISHTGSLTGYATYVSYIPELKIGVIVLVNSARSQVRENLAQILYAYMFERFFPTADYDEAFGLALSVPFDTTMQQQEYAVALLAHLQIKAFFDANPQPIIDRFRHPAFGDIELFSYTNPSSGQSALVFHWQERYWAWTGVENTGPQTYIVTAPDVVWQFHIDRAIGVTTNAAGSQITAVTLGFGIVLPDLIVPCVFTRVE